MTKELVEQAKEKPVKEKAVIDEAREKFSDIEDYKRSIHQRLELIKSDKALIKIRESQLNALRNNKYEIRKHDNGTHFVFYNQE